MEMERRLFVRFTMTSSVTLSPEKDDLVRIQCDLCDLSLEGLGVYSPKNILVERIKFAIFNHELNVNLKGTARVVFCKSVRYNDKDRFRVGLEFLEVDRDDVRDILKRVRDIPPENR